MTRPTWAEISRARLLSNYAYLRGLAPGDTELLAVVKADAYGHGLLHCAPILANAGASWLGVTSVEEGVRARMLCRDAGLKPHILIMAGVWRGEAEALIEHDLSPVVWEDYQLDLIESAAGRLSSGKQSIGVHLELDTGMSRQGIQAPATTGGGVADNSDADDATARLTALLQRFDAESPLRLEGLMTHFSAPEDGESDATAHQLDRLEAALHVVVSSGLNPEWLHAGSSATLIAGGVPLTRLQSIAKSFGARLMLRPGLSLYGYAPRFAPTASSQELAAQSACKPVLCWKTRIISLRTLAAGETVGYNSTFRAARTTRVALLPVGYADGLNRLLSNCGVMLVHGTAVPIAGRISMDHTVIDVTDVTAGISADTFNVAIGDEVVILGAQQHSSISAYDHADLAGTIPWEVLCDIGARVQRILVE